MLLAAELKPARANDKTQKLIPKEISPIVVKQKVCKNYTNVNPLLFNSTFEPFPTFYQRVCARDLP